MKNLDFGRYALSTCAAVALLEGCSQSQPPMAHRMRRRKARVALTVRTPKSVRHKASSGLTPWLSLPMSPTLIPTMSPPIGSTQPAAR